MFINYNVNTGLSINTYRQAGGYAGDIADLVVAYQNENENVCCDLAGAKDALCDGSFLAGTDCTQEAVECVFDFIEQWERENQ